MCEFEMLSAWSWKNVLKEKLMYAGSADNVCIEQAAVEVRREHHGSSH